MSVTLADEDGRLRIVVNASLVAMVRLRFELLSGHDAQRRQSDQQDGSRNFDRVRHDPAAGKELNFASSHAGYIAIINGHRRAHLENESDDRNHQKCWSTLALRFQNNNESEYCLAVTVKLTCSSTYPQLRKAPTSAHVRPSATAGTSQTQNRFVPVPQNSAALS